MPPSRYTAIATMAPTRVVVESHDSPEYRRFGSGWGVISRAFIPHALPKQGVDPFLNTQVDSPPMGEDQRTTAIVQLFLNDLKGDSPAEPIVRNLLSHATGRLHLLCASMLSRDYPRLTQPPLVLQPEELLGGLVERLLKAMKKTHPPTVRQFFGLVNQHMRWELNELARRLDERSHALELRNDLVPAPESSGSGLSPNTRRMLQAIESLPDEEREAFELVRIQGMAPSEVADIIGVTDRTVQRRLNRALLRLMGLLKDLRPPESAGAPLGGAPES